MSTILEVTPGRISEYVKSETLYERKYALQAFAIWRISQFATVHISSTFQLIAYVYHASHVHGKSTAERPKGYFGLEELTILLGILLNSDIIELLNSFQHYIS